MGPLLRLLTVFAAPLQVGELSIHWLLGGVGSQMVVMLLEIFRLLTIRHFEF